MAHNSNSSRYFRILSLSATVLSFSASMSAASVISYELTLRFDGDYVAELVSTPSEHEDDDWIQEICRFGQDCYPTDFRPEVSYSNFRHFEIGQIMSANFTIGGSEAKCEITGWNYDYDCYVSSNTEFSASFYSTNPTGGISFDLTDGKLSYFGEAGSYRPFAVPGCKPIVEDFCDYSGYGAEFSILEVNGESISAVPIPAGVWLLLSAVGIMGALKRFS